MKKINWKKNLSSRKLWCALGSVIISLIAGLGLSEFVTGQITAIITALVSVVAYVLADACTDKDGKND